MAISFYNLGTFSNIHVLNFFSSKIQGAEEEKKNNFVKAQMNYENSIVTLEEN